MGKRHGLLRKDLKIAKKPCSSAGIRTWGGDTSDSRSSSASSKDKGLCRSGDGSTGEGEEHSAIIGLWLVRRQWFS